MVKVKSLSPSKKRYEVVFENDGGSESVFSVSEDLVVDYRLVPGKILDDFAFSSFTKAVLTDGAYQKALAYGIRFPQTKSGMRQYLSERSVPGEAIDLIVEKLEKIRILDDLAYATLYAEDHMKIRHEGPRKIEFDLKRKGIAPEDIERAMRGFSPTLETANLNWLFDQKIESLSNRPTERAMMLMSQHLMSRGYDRERVEAFVSARSGLFSRRISEEELIRSDYLDSLRHADRLGWTGPERKAKIIHRLLQKGYRYPVIKKQMEKGEESDE